MFDFLSQIVYILNQTLSRRNSDVFSTNYATTTKDLVEHYNCGSLDQKVFTRDSIQVTKQFLSSTGRCCFVGTTNFAKMEVICRLGARFISQRG